jgi:GGDEF domain-containing protein
VQHAAKLIQETEFNRTISLGFAEFPKNGDSTYKVMKFSDVSLKNAKNEGVRA